MSAVVALEATGLGRQYRSFWALRDCTLEIPAGSVAALVGPKGAGKTTPDVARVHEVIRTSHAERQTTLLVRANGHVYDARWELHELGLEEIVLAYLEQGKGGGIGRRRRDLAQLAVTVLTGLAAAGALSLVFTWYRRPLDAVYQPASRFWLFQGIETALFGGVALVLIAFAAWWLHERAA